MKATDEEERSKRERAGGGDGDASERGRARRLKQSEGRREAKRCEMAMGKASSSCRVTSVHAVLDIAHHLRHG